MGASVSMVGGSVLEGDLVGAGVVGPALII